MQIGASLRVLAVQASLQQSLDLQAVSRRAHQGASYCIIPLTYLNLHSNVRLLDCQICLKMCQKGLALYSLYTMMPLRGNMLSLHAEVE